MPPAAVAIRRGEFCSWSARSNPRSPPRAFPARFSPGSTTYCLPTSRPRTTSSVKRYVAATVGIGWVDIKFLKLIGKPRCSLSRWEPNLTVPEHQQGLSYLNPIAVVQSLHAADWLAIDLGTAARSQWAKVVALVGRLDLGVPAIDGRVAEDANLGALVQPQPARLAGKQVDPPFLSSGKDHDPGPAEGLLDQGQEETQAAAQDDDPEGLAEVVSVPQADAQGLETIPPHEAPEAPADQAEDQALPRAVGKTLGHADAQAEHRPREGTAEEAAAEEADHHLAQDQPDRAADRAAAGTPQETERASFRQAPSRSGPQAFRKKPIEPPMIVPARASRR